MDFKEVHGSELRSWQVCRLKHRWEFTLGYVPKVVAEPLEFGQAFHRAMETLYNPDTWSLPLIDLYKRAKDVFVSTCQEQERKYLDMIEAHELGSEQAIDVSRRIDLGCRMLRKVVRTMDRKKYRPVTVEEEAFVTISHPDTGEPLLHEGLPVVYGIRVDAVLVDEHGNYYIVDWKTASQLLNDPTILEIDGQVATYCWALMRALRLRFSGFFYVQIRKDYPKQPKLLKVSRLGRRLSVSKQALTDYTTFKLTAQKLDKDAYEAGLYDEHLAWLKEYGPDFIKWFPVFKTEKQLESIGRDLYYAIKALLEPNDVFASSGRHCQWCSFQIPCLERQSGGDVQEVLDELYDKKDVYYILERERRMKVNA